MKIKSAVQQLFPPVIWDGMKSLRRAVRDSNSRVITTPTLHTPDNQELDLYWDPEFAIVLDNWGTGNAWDEIQFLMVNCRGRVLDIACGTGKTIEILSSLHGLEIHGCDISELLIQKAIERGIAKEHLLVCDATDTPYADDFFEYGYSIGSLEHFTEEGITKFIANCHRITRVSSWHMIPVSRSGKNEGWISPRQSYFNNSLDWWLDKYHSSYDTVHVLPSKWEDDRSLGKWFICIK